MSDRLALLIVLLVVAAVGVGVFLQHGPVTYGGCVVNVTGDRGNVCDDDAR